MSNLGHISIDLKSDTSDFAANVNRAVQKLSEIGNAANQAKAILVQSDAASKQLAGSLSDAGTAAGQATTDTTKLSQAQAQLAQNTSKAAESSAKLADSTKQSAQHIETWGAAVLHAVEATAAFVATELGLKALSAQLLAETPIFASHGAAVASWGEKISSVGINALRAMELIRAGFSLPAVATVGIGIAAHELAKKTYSEGQVLEQQSRTAAFNGTPITPQQVAALSAFGDGSKNLALFNASGGANLADIARQLSAIQDPYDRAAKALELFKGNTEAAKTALEILDSRFAENSRRVQEWGLTYSEDARQNILEFTRDIDSLKHPFQGLADTIHETLQQAKTELVSFFAFVYTEAKQSVKWTPITLSLPGALVGAQLGIQGAGGNSASTAFGGLLSYIGAMFRSGGKRTPEEQLSLETQQNLGGDVAKRLNSGSKQFQQSVIGSSLTDLSALNQAPAKDDLTGLRERLTRLQEQRTKVLREYFEVTPDGKLQFKTSISNIDKATGVGSLTDVNSLIKGVQAQIQAAEDAKKTTTTSVQSDPFATRLLELKAELQGVQVELRAVGSQNPVFVAMAKGASDAEKAVAAINKELDLQQKAHLNLGQQADIIGMETRIELTKMQAEQQKSLADKMKADQDELQSNLAKENESIQEKIRLLNEAAQAAKLEAAAEGLGPEQAFRVQLNAKVARARGEGGDALASATEAAGEAEHQAALAKSVAQLNRETEAIKEQTAALLGGIEARRQAQLDKIAQSGESPDVIAAEQAKLRAQFGLEDLQSGRSQTASQGARAYFQGLVDNAKSAGQQVHEILGNAFQGLNDQLVRMVEGQKVSWSGFFKSLAGDLAKMSLQGFEANLGKMILGSGVFGSAGAPGGTPGFAGPVAALGGGGGGGGGGLGGLFGGIFGGLGKLFHPGSSGSLDLSNPGDQNAGYNISRDSSGLLIRTPNLLGGLLGGGGDGGSGVSGLLGSIFGGFMAGGGETDTDKAYIVGEHGPELFMPGARGTVTPNHMLAAHGGQAINIYQDNRGTDPVLTEIRTRKAIQAAHNSAIVTAQRSIAEQQKRQPESKGR